MGVVGLTKTLMKEWGRYNVTVNPASRFFPADEQRDPDQVRGDG